MTKPTTFLLDADRLQTNKAALKKGDATLQTALNTLLSRADSVLTRPAHSVMEKSKRPPAATNTIT